MVAVSSTLSPEDSQQDIHLLCHEIRVHLDASAYGLSDSYHSNYTSLRTLLPFFLPTKQALPAGRIAGSVLTCIPHSFDSQGSPHLFTYILLGHSCP